MHQTPFYAWKRQLQDQEARAFDPGFGWDGEEAHEREIEKLRAKIGQLRVERNFLPGGLKISAPDRRALLDHEHG